MHPDNKISKYVSLNLTSVLVLLPLLPFHEENAVMPSSAILQPIASDLQSELFELLSGISF